MVKGNKSKLKSKKTNKNSTPRNSRHNWRIVAIALYITFLLLSTIPYIADRAVESTMRDSYEYHLTYPHDGRQTHYYVERVNTSQIGKIDLVYKTATNSLIVNAQNIKVLHIYCRSMYEDECREVYGIDPLDNSNYYKWYFIEKNHLNVNIDSDHEIEELSFIDTPIPYEVIVNEVKWTESNEYFYTENYSTALSNVPAGHTNVDIYFKSRTGTPPNAILNASKTLIIVNKTIDFDASGSYDIDGTIVTYILDFGDGNFRSGSKLSYQYPKPGVYGVILMVIDNDELVDHAFVNISVVNSSNIPEIQGFVPNQVKPEDSPPWTLNLSIYEPIPSSDDIKFYWYLTGENNSLYSVAGENSSKDRLIFIPVTDAFGSNLVTLWLVSTENLSTSQPLWINITPVNDPPILHTLPDLIIHYDDSYTFNYEPYVEDKETSRNDLTLEIYDGYEEGYITVDGLNAIYNYPKSMSGETVYATVTLSDGEDTTQEVISIQVTSDFVPKLIKKLPNIWIYEGTKKYNVFDLDDYFTDPDNDAIYFSYGFSHLEITINKNHTVDILAESEWVGSELVTFRATDPIGALAEDIIVVTVLPVNDPPIISGVPNMYVRYDYDYRFDLTPFVHDNDNITEELKIIPSDREHIRLDIRDNMVIIMNYPIEFLGQSLQVRLTVFDGLESGFQDIIVTITDDFPPELIIPIPDIVFLEDQSISNIFNLDYYFLDVDGDTLFYTSGNKFINITIHNNHTVGVSAPKDWFGSELVYFRATDPTGALQQDLVLVTVVPVNDAPVILPIPKQFGNESERWKLDLKTYVFDVDNNISELDIFANNDFVIASGSSLIFFGSKNLPNKIEIVVSDGEYSVSQVIDIQLNLKNAPWQPTLWELFVNILPIVIIILLMIISISGAFYHKKSRFIAEEVFLIHQGGTLITHLTRRKQANVDDVIFSGMFTAVQDFIKDSFVSDRDDDDLSTNDWALDEMSLGENKILIERSKHTYLAVIFSGQGAKRLRRIVIKLLEVIETKYEKVLPTWDGNINQLKDTNEILSVLIKLQEDPETQEAAKIARKDKTYAIKYTIKPGETPSITTSKKLIKDPHIIRTTISKPLPQAIVYKKQFIAEFKELLECSQEQTGADRPGLAALQLNSQHIDGFSNMDPKKLPVALSIQSKRLLPKTIVVQKDRFEIAGKEISDALVVNDMVKRKTRHITIIDPGTGKKSKIDPSKSLFQQLAESDE